ncbi:MAG TPA: hypothetical protein VJI13_04770 [Candidatus Norongarragalinales archaeon]|nr:hypothetical protein [Candidatus Norongarragalinales archaeon]
MVIEWSGNEGKAPERRPVPKDYEETPLMRALKRLPQVKEVDTEAHAFVLSILQHATHDARSDLDLAIKHLKSNMKSLGGAGELDKWGDDERERQSAIEGRMKTLKQYEHAIDYLDGHRRILLQFAKVYSQMDRENQK